MKKIPLLIILILITLISSCTNYRYIYYDRALSPEINEILLIAIDFENKTSKEIQRVHYPSSSFVLENFSLGLIKEFNQNKYKIKINVWDDLNTQEIVLKQNQIPLVHSINSTTNKTILVFDGKLKWRKLKKYQKIFNHEFYITLELVMSAWEQDVRGFVKVKNRKGKIIWREELKHQSPYIHNDPSNPYRSKNYKIIQKPISQNSNHYLEMEKTFEQLGKTVAISLKETLDKIKNIK